MSRPVASRWTAPTAEGPLHARVSLPGSKSAAARALVLAALAQGPSRLRGLPDARDTELMRDGLAGFGVRCADGAITPPTALEAGSVVDCGLAGTVMRFLPAVASLADGPTRFVGDQRASSRPVAPLLAALARLGASVDGNSLPFSVAGRAVGRRVEVDASASSQFVSALLLIGPRLPHGLALRHVGGALPSAPHIEMTLLMLRQRGVEAATTSQTSWEVAPGEIAALDCAIEPDLTNTATFLAAALVAGGEVVADWPAQSVQPGPELLDALAAFGADIEVRPGRVVARGDGAIAGADLDLGRISEFAPVAAALAALADSPSRLRGVAHIRGHETDRLAALEAGVNALGGVAAQTADGLRITPRPLQGGLWHACGDHRMAHAAALLGLRVPGIEVDDIGVTAKTIADFPDRWASLVSQGAAGG